jgi:hypothetical protein
LDVVDCDHDRRVRGESVQRAPDGDGERPRIRTKGSVFDEECSLERTALRRRQCGQHGLENVLEQVAEAGVRKPSLSLRWPRREDAQSARARLRDPCKPECRLANPRLTLQHKRRSPA